ncbi:subtilase family protein [Clostridium acetireducens DSM 10703]|uniref:Subtilase family protein n=1 Tax=Clostridium acetireducens DSM 10703 TaxID=1121290 RepID=A0A1E8F1N0_9CLOT|nr:S8/S53 family peptidase [Clostridium acetireducens]OFI07538.1 subtilase family protein [Clostridium acetireducens DSM 10703]
MWNCIKKFSIKKKVCFSLIIILVLFVVFAFTFPIGKYEDCKVNGNSGIAKAPKAVDYKRGKLKELPKYDGNSEKDWQVDLRSFDLSELDIKNNFKDLMYADFDSKTKWPSSLPKKFDKNAIMEYGKNPGLNLRKLHEKGITGKGVSMAIIDQTLLTNHKEYKDRLKFYEEIHNQESGSASMHGAAVSSIAVGKTVGVAPEADLYYIAETHGKVTLSSFVTGFPFDFTYLAKSIDRIVEINKTLPKDKKIRAISMSIGWNEKQKGFKEVDAAVKRAKNEGILVVSTSFDRYYKVGFWGLGRDSMKNPDDFKNYEPGMFWSDTFFKHNEKFNLEKNIMVPMDSRCTASPTGISDYAFYRQGGLSWSVPYIAALYTLCCQVNPDITPDEFLKAAVDTGDVVQVEKNNKKYNLGKIVNPERLIEKVHTNKL